MTRLPDSSPDLARTGQPLHASAVALAGRAVVVIGPSGSGKSALCLALIARGAILIADDRVIVVRQGAGLLAMAPPPPAPQGLIEARGMGLLRVGHQASAPLALMVDMGRAADTRLPAPRHHHAFGIDTDLIAGAKNPILADVIMLLLTGSARLQSLFPDQT